MEDLADGLMEAKMMIRRIRMRLKVAARTIWDIIPIVSMIRAIEIREEEVEDKDLEEEAFMGNGFTTEKKGILNLNVTTTKEGHIKELKARKEFHMLMNMLDPHILKMLKEEKSYLIEKSH